jgi:hypothetical protein
MTPGLVHEPSEERQNHYQCHGGWELLITDGSIGGIKKNNARYGQHQCAKKSAQYYLVE